MFIDNSTSYSVRNHVSMMLIGGYKLSLLVSNISLVALVLKEAEPNMSPLINYIWVTREITHTFKYTLHNSIIET